MSAITVVVVTLSVASVLWSLVGAVLKIAAVVSWSWWLILVPGLAVVLLWGVGYLLIYFAIRDGNGEIY